MTKLLPIFFLFLAASCFSAKAKTKPAPIFQRHMISVSVTNAVSSGFYNSPNGPTRGVRFYDSPYPYNPSVGLLDFKPGYALVTKIGYSYGINRSWRVGTGLSYIFQGMRVYNGAENLLPSYYSVFPMTGSRYVGSLMIPLHAIWRYPLGRGALTLTFGPEFTLPVHTYSIYSNVNIPLRNRAGQIRYTSAQTTQYASMGVDLRVGYDIPISRTASFDIGPVISFNNLAQFSRKDGLDRYLGRQFFTYYAGVDMAFHFGLKKDKGKKSGSSGK